MSYPDVLTLAETTELSRIVARVFARMTAAITAARARQADHRTHTYVRDAEAHVLRDIGMSGADVRRALLARDRR